MTTDIVHRGVHRSASAGDWRQGVKTGSWCCLYHRQAVRFHQRSTLCDHRQCWNLRDPDVSLMPYRVESPAAGFSYIGQHSEIPEVALG